MATGVDRLRCSFLPRDAMLAGYIHVDGATENARHENTGRSKNAGVENARHEFAAPDCRGGKCET